MTSTEVHARVAAALAVLLGGGADVIEVRLAQAFRLDLTLWGTHAVAYLNHAQPGTGYAAVAP